MRSIQLLLAALALTLSGVAPDSRPQDPKVSHCVIRVEDQKSDGEFVMGPASCYEALSEAMVAASQGAADPDALAALSGPELLSDPEEWAPLLSFNLGIHFDGANGTGSSISIVGSSCTGGHWNTGPGWANRISSSWNGCYRLRHFDQPNKAGASYSTTGVGQTDNLSSVMNNKTESVSYHST